MKRTKWIHTAAIVLFAVFFTAKSAFASGGDNIRFVNISNRDGLPDNTIYSLCQDYKGFIWVGTVGGLCRYDGNSIVTYTSESHPTLPNNRIRFVFEDDRYRLWISTLHGIRLYDRQSDTFTTLDNPDSPYNSRTIHQAADGTIYFGGGGRVCFFDERQRVFVPLQVAGRNVTGDFNVVLTDKDGFLWLGSENDGILCIDRRRDTIRHFIHDPRVRGSLVSNNIQSLYKDSRSRIWVGTQNKGVCYYDELSDRFVLLEPVPPSFVRAICEDARGNLWVGTEDGLYIHNPLSGTTTLKKRTGDDSYSVSDNTIYSLLRDREDNMLVGTYYGGICIAPNSFSQFRYYPQGAGPGHLSGRIVKQIVPDGRDGLWVVTKDGGINRYDRVRQTFRRVMLADQNTKSDYSNITSLLHDAQGNLWVGTNSGNLNRYDPRSGRRISSAHIGSDDNQTLNSIYYVLDGGNGTLWLGTKNGVARYDIRTGRFYAFKPEILGRQWVDLLLRDSDNNIWITTRFVGVYCYNPRTDEMQHFRHGPDGLPDNFINTLYEDGGRNVWIGTQQGGLSRYDRKNATLRNFTIADHLPSNTILSICEDNERNLWVATNNGLSCYNPESDDFTNYSISDGLPNKQFSHNSVYRDPSGEIFLGTIDGMISFMPDRLRQPGNTPSVELTGIRSLGEDVPVGDDTPPDGNYASMEKSWTVRLTHRQARSFSVRYTVPTVSHAASIFYLARFESREGWDNLGAQNQITFADLRPGEYTLLLKASFNNRWMGGEPVTRITLKISPPFWLSNAAYCLYAACLLLLSWLLYRYQASRQRQRNLLLAERLEKQKIAEVNDIRLNFFTNVSHQLRLPLTIIISPLQSLLGKRELDPAVERKLQTITRNAERMKALIDELILFTKVTTDKEKAVLCRGDVLGFIHQIAREFEVLAEERSNIVFRIDVPVAGEKVWFDAPKLEKIVYNLLSNAFKYTDEGIVKIKADLYACEGFDTLELSVSDTGIGIDEAMHERIFENYYQANDRPHDRRSGFGIGLSMTRELAALHGGAIAVESTPNVGSVFTVTLCVDRRAFDPRQIHDGEEGLYEKSENYSFLLSDVSSAGIEALVEAGSGLKTILVVEDNIELLNHYHELLSDRYNVILSSDGAKGLEAAIAKMPDLVMSDVMMPSVSGYELARSLKSRIDTCHIPIILLTAKVGEQAEYEAYGSGVELYIEKPFSPQILLTQISNLLNLKESLRRKYVANQLPLDEVVVDDKDKQLIEKIERYIRDHIDNEELSVNDIVGAVGLSRTLLYVKLKAAVGLSATQFITNIRLKESMRLLLQNRNISEVAYECGFSSPNYYARCFRKQFGISPTEYRESLEREKENR